MGSSISPERNLYFVRVVVIVLLVPACIEYVSINKHDNG